METELKLLIDTKYKEALLKHPLLQGATPREQSLADTYFDTAHLRLRHSNAGLRVRRADGAWIQNMKRGDAANGGLHSRFEWESPVAGPNPDLAKLREVVDDKKTRRELLGTAALKMRLAPVFTTKVKRTVWDLHLSDGDIECAFDQGKVESGGSKSPISELELELKSGDPAHLFDFALALQADIPLRIGNRSKADRGYALLAPFAPAAVKATRLALTTDMTVEQAFQAIASNCLKHIQDNDQGVAGGTDVESLHQMRVGMRRLRSALSMFKDVLRLPADLQKEVDWLAAELGDARDWDVLAGSTLPALSNDIRDPEIMKGLQQEAEDQAHQHHIAAAEVVASTRYTRLLLQIARWVQSRGWHEDKAAGTEGATRLARPVKKFAIETLKRDQRRLRARARNLHAATAEERHRVRIAAKKTRYAAEFFESLFASKAVLPYIKTLSRLQDELGLLNDGAVAARLLTEIPARQPQLEGSVGFAKGFLEARAKGDGKLIEHRWKQFAARGRPR